MENSNEKNKINEPKQKSSINITKDSTDNEIRLKCKEIVSLPNQKAWGNLIENYLKECDKNFLKNNENDKFIKNKIDELHKFVDILSKKKIITIKDYGYIKELSLSKGGFLTSENRRILYKKIYLLNHRNSDKMLYVDYEANIDKNWDFEGIDIFSEKRIYKDLMDSPAKEKDDNIIHADCIRSKIFSIFSDNKNILNIFIQDLEKYIKLMVRLNNNIYNYFQGYHDIGLYFLFLYHKSPHYAVSVFQRFSEFNLKEQLSIKDTKNIKNNNKKEKEIGYSFLDTLNILKFILNYLYPNVQNFFEKHCVGGLCMFAAKWIISLLTHILNDTNTIYRLFDYFILSHPLAIHFLSAVLIKDYLDKVGAEKIDSFEAQTLYFQNLKFKDADFDEYILKSDKLLQDSLTSSKFEELFKNLKLTKFFPLMNNQVFTEKWVKVQNQEECRNNFWYYLGGQWKMFKSFFTGDKDDE